MNGRDVERGGGTSVRWGDTVVKAWEYACVMGNTVVKAWEYACVMGNTVVKAWEYGCEGMGVRL
jgi:hypothetical protein